MAKKAGRSVTCGASQQIEGFGQFWANNRREPAQTSPLNGDVKIVNE